MRCSPRRSDFVAIALLLAPAVAVADTQREAKAHVQAAQKAHEAGDFRTALTELLAANDKDPQPDLLYAIAQVHAKLGQCSEAIGFYEQFLATNPSDAAAQDTREAIDVCKAQLPAPAPAPVVVAPPPPPTLPWYRDRLGAGLVAGGVVASAIGLVVYASARGDVDAAEMAPDVTRYDELIDSARSKRLASVVFIGGGVALIGVGVARIVMKRHPVSESLAIVPTRDGGMVAVGGSF